MPDPTTFNTFLLDEARALRAGDTAPTSRKDWDDRHRIERADRLALESAIGRPARRLLLVQLGRAALEDEAVLGLERLFTQLLPERRLHLEDERPAERARGRNRTPHGPCADLL